MSDTVVERIFCIACACACANVVAASGIVFYDSATSSQSLVVSAPSALSLSAPRLNDLGEIVWSQQLTMFPTTVGVFSNVRGQIASGIVSDADINNDGEIIWGFSVPETTVQYGIESTTRGIILPSSPYQRPAINNHGEIVATDFDGIWTNEHGYAPGVGRIPGGAEINDSGEIVYHAYDFVAGYRVYSTVSGILSESDWAVNPDINNLGEIVWQQSIRPDGLPPQWEIWSNLRGKIGNGEEPSINDAGEVVWKFWDGNDFEVYSSVRGQISSNDGADEWPRINNRGDIAWWQSEVSLSPEPSSIVLAVFAIAGLLIRRR